MRVLRPEVRAQDDSGGLDSVERHGPPGTSELGEAGSLGHGLCVTVGSPFDATPPWNWFAISARDDGSTQGGKSHENGTGRGYQLPSSARGREPAGKGTKVPISPYSISILVIPSSECKALSTR